MKIDHDSTQNLWVISWDATQLQLILKDGDLVCLHFGAPRVEIDQTFSFFADTLLATRSVARVHLGEENRPTTWEVIEWLQPSPDVFAITLKDRFEPLQANLQFIFDATAGVLRCKTQLSNVGSDEPLKISSAVSFSVALPKESQEAVYLAGTWSGETQTARIPVGSTPLQLESRSGKTGYEYAPYLAIQIPDHTYVFQLCWSGNWQMNMRRDYKGVVRVSGGLNDWGLRYHLLPGENWDLPDALLVFCKGDLNAATQRLHDYRRSSVRPDPDRVIPVQFNSWYPYFGESNPGHLGVHFDMAKLKQSADDSVKLGCEVFVLDGGWYALENNPDNPHWFDDVGDWEVNRNLFPNGLEEISQYCLSLGMPFGLWFEPEASGPGSVIQREHPEWMHKLGDQLIPHGRYLNPSRSLINLGIPEARAFQRELILEHLRANHATWMKWDYNMNLNQGGWSPGLSEDITNKDPLIAHVEGVYTLMDEIRAAMPDLIMESCAGGGGRFDAAIAAHSHVHWASDEITTLRRLAINFGTLLAHPAIEVNTWLVDWPPHYHRNPHSQKPDERGDLAFRTRAAMLGSFGISAPTWRWSEEEIEFVRDHVQLYKDFVRPVLQTGDQYLLTEAPPIDGNGDWAAAWYVTKEANRGMLFAFRLASDEDTSVFTLSGLEAEKRYTVRTIVGNIAEANVTHCTGLELSEGLQVTLDQPYRAALVLIEEDAGPA